MCKAVELVGEDLSWTVLQWFSEAKINKTLKGLVTGNQVSAQIE